MQAYIELLQGYYKFLSLGKFFEAEAKTHPTFWEHTISPLRPLSIPTGEHTKFSINTELISSLLQEINKRPNSKNVFGYLTEISAFRGIFSTMREMIENSPSFRTFLQAIFGEEYFPFEQVIRFLRNVLSHSSTPSLLIQQEDFEKQKFFLTSKKDFKGLKIRLHFVYKQHLPEREGSPEYVCEIEINFAALKTGISLWEVVSLHQMYLLSELCYNISKVISARMKHSALQQKNTIPPPPTKKTQKKH